MLKIYVHSEPDLQAMNHMASLLRMVLNYQAIKVSYFSYFSFSSLIFCNFFSLFFFTTSHINIFLNVFVDLFLFFIFVD